MKKYYFLAASALVALASCSSSDDATNDQTPGASGEVISLTTAAPSISPATRGTGTVGAVGTENKWEGQIVKVFMFNKGTLTLASLTGEETNPIYNDTPMYTPGAKVLKSGVWESLNGIAAAASGLASCTNGDIKYYPLQGQYDFWGYRLDDAATAAYDKTTDPEIVAIPFTINGSQDVLVAQAQKDDDYSKAVSGSGLDKEDVYSAKAARANVQPTLEFTHELTRLTFAIKAGNNNAVKGTASDWLDKTLVKDYQTKVNPNDEMEPNKLSKGVYVDSIKIFSAVTGKLIAATTNDAKPQGLTFGTESTDSAWVSLMQRKDNTVPASENLEKFVSVVPESESDFGPIGEALLVAPETTCKYRIQVYMHQYKQGKEDWWVNQDPANKQYYEKNDLYYPAKYMTAQYIDLTDGGGNSKFPTAKNPKGYSFKINMTVFGLEPIQVTTTLVPWTDGGETSFTME